MSDSSSTTTRITATPGAIYLAGFAQSGDPHAGIVFSMSSDDGYLAHIKIDKGTGQWAYEFSKRSLSHSFSLTSLIRIHDGGSGMTPDRLRELTSQVEVPVGDTHGECLKWVMNAVDLLAQQRVVSLSSGASLQKEFAEFCAGNRNYVGRATYPNVKVSEYCF